MRVMLDCRPPNPRTVRLCWDVSTGRHGVVRHHFRVFCRLAGFLAGFFEASASCNAVAQSAGEVWEPLPPASPSRTAAMRVLDK